MDKLIIIGFQKCGQTALRKYLNCGINELVYYPDAVERFEIHNKGLRPVFITRDPTEKLWSEYHYFDQKQRTFIEFLDYKSTELCDGYTTPIERCDYFRWIDRFKHLNPLVLSLENMQTLMKPENVNQKIKSRLSMEEHMAIRTRITNQLVRGLR